MIPKCLNWKSQWSGQSCASRNLVKVKTQHLQEIYVTEGFPGDAVVKKLPANAGDTRDSGLVSGSGRSPGIENGNPLQYSRRGNPMDQVAWQATVYGIAKSRTWLSDFPFTFLPKVFNMLNYLTENIATLKSGWRKQAKKTRNFLILS